MSQKIPTETHRSVFLQSTIALIFSVVKLFKNQFKKMVFRETLVYLCHKININDVQNIRNTLLRHPHILLQSSASDLSEGMLSPLWEAMILGHTEICKILIDYGANVNERYTFEKNEIYGLTFLQRIAFLGDNWRSSKKMAEVLISHNADVNAYCRHLASKSPLQIAIQCGNLSYAEFLLKNGARLEGGPEWINEVPMTFILNAPKIRQTKILKMLIKYGFNTKTRNKKCGIDYLIYTIHYAIKMPGKIDATEIARILLNSGVTINNIDDLGQSALFYAIILGNHELTSLLIQGGADIELRSKHNGDFPLLAAVYRNNISSIDLLLSSGANINAKNDNGWTALHMACFNRRKKAIEFLVEKGALISLEDKNDKTPFALLDPQLYKESDIPCINIMVKEIAKLKFLNENAVSKKDLDLIHSHLVVEESFKNCIDELSKMSSTKFYGSYSYYYVLTISKNNFRKLAILTKNEKFITDFHESLNTFSYYQNDLDKIFEEAVAERMKLEIVDFKLRIAFGDIFPDVVLTKLANNLTAEDLK